jgi:DTW domain-containing protein YfiP
LENRVALLVLQHPQEQDRTVGTARLATRVLANSVLKVGLSWPSLAKALGREADPSRWAVLHLGAARAADMPRDRDVVVVDAKGAPLPNQEAALAGLRGLVVFDGSWSQAKTLWWRNPWVLKARRVVLNPKSPSLYGKLRREPRREGLSTIEAAGLALSRIEKRPEIETTLRDAFGLMLQRYRAAYPAGEAPSGDAAKRPGAPRKRWGKRPRRPAGSAP